MGGGRRRAAGVGESKVTFVDLVSLNSLPDIQMRLRRIKVNLWDWTLEM